MKKNEKDFPGSAILQMMVQQRIYTTVQLSKLIDTQDQEQKLQVMVEIMTHRISCQLSPVPHLPSQVYWYCEELQVAKWGVVAIFVPSPWFCHIPRTALKIRNFAVMFLQISECFQKEFVLQISLIYCSLNFSVTFSVWFWLADTVYAHKD